MVDAHASRQMGRLRTSGTDGAEPASRPVEVARSLPPSVRFTAPQNGLLSTGYGLRFGIHAGSNWTVRGVEYRLATDGCRWSRPPRGGTAVSSSQHGQGKRLPLHRSYPATSATARPPLVVAQLGGYERRLLAQPEAVPPFGCQKTYLRSRAKARKTASTSHVSAATRGRAHTRWPSRLQGWPGSDMRCGDRLRACVGSR